MSERNQICSSENCQNSIDSYCKTHKSLYFCVQHKIEHVNTEGPHLFGLAYVQAQNPLIKSKIIGFLSHKIKESREIKNDLISSTNRLIKLISKLTSDMLVALNLKIQGLNREIQDIEQNSKIFYSHMENVEFFNLAQSDIPSKIFNTTYIEEEIKKIYKKEPLKSDLPELDLRLDPLVFSEIKGFEARMNLLRTHRVNLKSIEAAHIAVFSDGSKFVTIEKKGLLKIWDAVEKVPSFNKPLGYDIEVTHLSLTSNNECVVFAGHLDRINTYIIVWSIREAKKLAEIQATKGVRFMMVLKNSNVIFAEYSGEVKLWDREKDTISVIAKHSHESIHSVLCISKNYGETIFASGGMKGKVCVFDLKTNTGIQKFALGDNQRISCLEFPNKFEDNYDHCKYLVSGTIGKIFILNIRNRNIEFFLNGIADYVVSIIFSKNNRYFISLEEGNKMVVWNWKRRDLEMKIKSKCEILEWLKIFQS